MIKSGTTGLYYMHRLDPAVILSAGNAEQYVFCLAYAAGFLVTLLWMLRKRERLGLQRFDACEGRYVMRVLLAGILMFSLTIPAGWTGGVIEELREHISTEGAAHVTNYPVYDSCVTQDLCLSGPSRLAEFLNGVSETVSGCLTQVALHSLNMSAAQSLNRKF